MFRYTNYFPNVTRRSQRMIVLSAAGVILFSVIAYASIPDANGVIHGCYKKSGGALRVIDSAIDQCADKEIPVSWNQTGPQGLPGPQGEQGPAGPQGPAGSSTRLITVGTANGFRELMLSCSDAIRSMEFVKQSDASNLRITYHDRALVNLNFVGGYSVDVLINDWVVSPTPIDHVVGNGSSFTAFGYANGIPAGTYTLTSHYNFGGSSPPSTCFREPRYTVEIEEIQPND